MKRITILVVILLALWMNACASGVDTTSQADLPAPEEDAFAPASEDIPVAEDILTTEYENAASLRNQLALGILALKGTPQAVTAEQAADLLPLWQAMSLLEQDQNAAQAEVEALQTQLIKNMTIEQLQTIAVMNLTNDDLVEFYAEQGIEMGTESNEAQGMRGANKDMTEEERAAFRATRQASEAGATSSGVEGGGRERRSVLTNEVIALLNELING